MLSLRTFILPASVRLAVATLVDHGISAKKLEALLFPRPLRARGKPGRPRYWDDRAYRTILSIYDQGADILRNAGKRVTDFDALMAVLEPLGKVGGTAIKVTRALARADAKRLPDARKAVRK